MDLGVTFLVFLNFIRHNADLWYYCFEVPDTR